MKYSWLFFSIIIPRTEKYVSKGFKYRTKRDKESQDKLAEEILDGKLQSGSKAKVSAKDEEIIISTKK